MKYKQGAYGRLPGHKEDKAKTTRALKKYLLDARGSKCECCGYAVVDALVVHHIIERSEGGSNDRWNLLLICPNCHMEIHKNLEGRALACQAVLKTVAVFMAAESSTLSPSAIA